MKKRSFTEYVKNKFDNLIWSEIEKFCYDKDADALSLRLYNITASGEINIEDINVKYVSVYDRPRTCIAFDIVCEVEFTVYDKDRYHTDKEESTCAWFKLNCEGDLKDNLDSLKVNEVEMYSCKSNSAAPMSDSLVRYIKKDELEDIAASIIKKYYKEAYVQANSVDHEVLTERLGLKVIQEKLSLNESVFGQIFFRDSSAKVYRDDIETEIEVKRGTILVDCNANFQRNLGCYNNTIFHECVHWILHQKAFELERLYNENLSRIRCNVVGGIEGSYTDSTSWMEWQANALAPKLQMPLVAFKLKAAEIAKKYRDNYSYHEMMPYLIEELSLFFNTSKQATKLRLIDAGYEQARGALIYLDNHYVEAHNIKKDELAPNQTYSISAQDAALITITNSEIRRTVTDGEYQFVDNHFIKNNPKYLEKDTNGITRLTRYAKANMSECALKFDLKLKGHIDSNYHTECFLNRDKNSPFTFEIEFNGDLSKSEQAQVLKNHIDDAKQLYEKLSNNLCASLKECLKWKNITQKEISDRTGISEKSVGKIFNGVHTPTLNNLVLICLAMNLHPIISNHLIEKSGHRFLYNNDDHIWMDFALKSMYTKDIEEVRTFLIENGVANI